MTQIVNTFTKTYEHTRYGTGFVCEMNSNKYTENLYYIFELGNVNQANGLILSSIANLLLNNMEHSNVTSHVLRRHAASVKCKCNINSNRENISITSCGYNDKDKNCKMVFPPCYYNPVFGCNVGNNNGYKYPSTNYMKHNIYYIEFYNKLKMFCAETLKWNNIIDIDVHFINLDFGYDEHDLRYLNNKGINPLARQLEIQSKVDELRKSNKYVFDVYFRNQYKFFGPADNIYKDSIEPYYNYILIIIGNINEDVLNLQNKLEVCKTKYTKLEDQYKQLESDFTKKISLLEDRFIKQENLKFDELKIRTKNEYIEQKEKINNQIKEVEQKLLEIKLDDIILIREQNDTIRQKLDEANSKLLTVDIDNIPQYQQYITTLSDKFENNKKLIEEIDTKYNLFMMEKYKLETELEKTIIKLDGC